MIRRRPRSTLFPTRRSSDLTWVALAERMAEILYRGTGMAIRIIRLPAGRLHGIFNGQVFLPIPLRRSEEHTSELQSQSNLVCRLLLEKKKKTIAQLTRSQQS